jgi:hypothetical protein
MVLDVVTVVALVVVFGGLLLLAAPRTFIALVVLALLPLWLLYAVSNWSVKRFEAHLERKAARR